MQPLLLWPKDSNLCITINSVFVTGIQYTHFNKEIVATSSVYTNSDEENLLIEALYWKCNWML